jgi:hypothetical protein
MQSQVIALLINEGCPKATLLVRRSNGQFALERIDPRVAAASRIASGWLSVPPQAPTPAI